MVALGVQADHLILLGSRHPQAGELCAKNAGPRWSRFQFSSVNARSSRRFEGHTYIGSGEWRKHFISDQSKWPACWPQMERSKFLSPEGKHFFKFEGMGRIGEEVRLRAQHLAKTGFGCELEDAGDGYSAYPVISGRPWRPATCLPHFWSVWLGTALCVTLISETNLRRRTLSPTW